MKVICSRCGKMVDKYNHDCLVKKQKEKEYNKKYNNKKTIKAIKNARWQKIRKNILETKGNYCQRCFYKYGIVNTKNIQIDHIIPREINSDLIYEENNLIPLCKSCNTYKGKKIHRKPTKEWKYPYKVNKNNIVYLDWQQKESENEIYDIHI